MSQFIVIAIDGPAASGKSSVAKIIAKKLNFVMINTGAMYRTIAWLCLQKNISLPLSDSDAKKLIIDSDWQFTISDLSSKVLVDGIDPTPHLNAEEVASTVAVVAKSAVIREFLVQKQQDYLKTHSLVMEGRDIGTVVFPDTPYKFFLHASAEVRQNRRKQQGMIDSIADRDQQDEQREESPLVQAKGAITIDSSELSLDEVVARIFSYLNQSSAFTTLLSQ